MTATVDGITVTGSPSEIASFIKLYKNKVTLGGGTLNPGLVTGVYKPGIVLC